MMKRERLFDKNGRLTRASSLEDLMLKKRFVDFSVKKFFWKCLKSTGFLKFKY
jgi:hypothetical protein